jgi:starch phosphorylase
MRAHIARMRSRLGMPLLDPPPLHPDALTIGFARRFVPYKRPDLLFTDLDRLAELVNHSERPVNLVFSGRAHPADEQGKALIQRVAKLVEDPRFRRHIVFLEGHNIHVGRQLYQGVDAWPTPQPHGGLRHQRHEGHANGALTSRCWTAGGPRPDGENGFAIGNGEVHVDPVVQHGRDAEALFRLLEEQVVPLYYDRDESGIPRAWLQRVKRSIRTRLALQRHHMVMDYTRDLYLPRLADSCQMPSV